MTETNGIRSYKDLIVWQKAMELVVAVYDITPQYPQSELYRLTSQTHGSVVSIPSNIAEGSRRSTRKDYCHFLNIAYGSGAELETQIEIAKRIPFGKDINFSRIDSLLEEEMRMLNKMISNMNST